MKSFDYSATNKKRNLEISIENDWINQITAEIRLKKLNKRLSKFD
jgi:hypothetical protein